MCPKVCSVKMNAFFSCGTGWIWGWEVGGIKTFILKFFTSVDTNRIRSSKL